MMNEHDFNSWACDIANDYAQALQEMCPDDYESWEVYSRRRLQQCDEAEAYVESNAKDCMDSNDLRDLRDPINDYGIEIKHHDVDNDDDDLPF